MHTDDPETTASMRRWLRLVSAELGVDPGLITESEQPLLELVSTVAHGPSRPGAPLTAFLIGVATGNGGDAVQLANQISALAIGHGTATT